MSAANGCRAADERPPLPPVGRPEDALPIVRVAGAVRFAGADVDDVRIHRIDRHRADGERRLVVGERFPVRDGAPRFFRLPQPALRASGVDDVGIGGVGRDRIHTSADRRQTAGRVVGLAIRDGIRSERTPLRPRVLGALVVVLLTSMTLGFADRVGRERPRRILPLAVEPGIERLAFGRLVGIVAAAGPGFTGAAAADGGGFALLEHALANRSRAGPCFFFTLAVRAARAADNGDQRGNRTAEREVRDDAFFQHGEGLRRKCPKDDRSLNSGTR
jgi:hypothetical protein